MKERSSRQLACMDWPWKSEDPAIHIILISDEQFVNLANQPDKAVEKMYPWADAPISLREYCRQGAERGATTLRLAYDYFFGGSQRGLYPDTDAFQDALKKVHDVAQEFGIGLEPSVLSPLELGMGYQAKTGESGRWMQYREGLRDPQTGEYSVMMWQHQQWCNNKGPTPVTLIGARAFAFHEERIPNTPFFAVNPAEIVELPSPTIAEISGIRADTTGHFKTVRVRVYAAPSPSHASSDGGDWKGIQYQTPETTTIGQGLSLTPPQPSAGKAGSLDRVLVVLLYRTVEMDYFSPQAPEFLDNLVQQYHERGISMTGVYADEAHIQQDWSYHAHMDNGQFTLRYVSEGFERAFAAQFGAEYASFAKYMVYFACHQHDFTATHEPKLPSQHVFGTRTDDVYRTLLFRRNYYQFLESNIVKLMVDARQKVEQLNGRSLDVYYHSTWAESPTCDAWTVDGVYHEWSPEEHRRQYEYTPEFLWSNTVHQASAACANQFSWNEFLTGGNDDTPEGGYADRNYYGRALACSLATLNRSPLASAGMWGMPPPVAERMTAVSEVFGALGHPAFRSVVDYAPRQIEVLFLYPQDLVAVEERFGSWMVQYGYANLITAEKLVEYGRVTADGLLAAKDVRYRALCVLYEPFPSNELLVLLETFVQKGGTLIWSSTPPMLSSSGDVASRQRMADLMGIRFNETPDPLGLALPARQVTFDGILKSVTPMTILTDFVVDRIFPVHPLEDSEPVAALRPGGTVRALCVGTRKAYPGGGQAVYLGFRPRDDQAASTGTEARTWFEVLHALGAYSGDDNPTVISRTTSYLACTFPNGAVALCPHYRHHEESWPGGFFRDEEADRRALEENPVPDDTIDLQEFRIAGQSVTYHGRHAIAWRRGTSSELVAFAGHECTGIVIDGRSFSWADQPVDIAWHPLRPEQQLPDVHTLYRVWCGTPAKVRLPFNLADVESLEVWQGAFHPGGRSLRKDACGRAGYGEHQVPFQVVDGQLIVDVDDVLCGHWLYVVRRG